MSNQNFDAQLADQFETFLKQEEAKKPQPIEVLDVVNFHRELESKDDLDREAGQAFPGIYHVGDAFMMTGFALQDPPEASVFDQPVCQCSKEKFGFSKHSYWCPVTKAEGL